VGTRIRRRRTGGALLVAAAAAVAGLNAALGDGAGGGPDAAQLSIRELVGERLVAGFAGRHPPGALLARIRRGDLVGVVLFSDNFADRADARRLIRRLQAIRRPPGLRDPLLVMVDQEGGVVKRLPGAPFASAEQMGRHGPAFSRRQGRLTARNLAAAGIGVDLAPVLDLGRPGGAIRGEHRSFASSAGQVSATAVPFALGLQSGGVAATAKHFPGFGAAAVNTDVGVARIALPAQTLRRLDEAPFRRFAKAGGRLVMMSSAIYPAFSERPAVFARPVATAELRDRLGFEGVAISDSLGAAAVRAFGGPARVARAAAAAGTDLLLFTGYRAAARADEALRAALRSGALRRDDFVASAQRVLDLRAALAR
jgi:beta-N-acetylhexosaminidase